MSYELVVVGCSWGGSEALRVILPSLAPDFTTPLVIAQHRSPDSRSDALLKLLQNRTALKIVEPHDKDPIEPGHAYVAPADYHLLVEPGAFGLSVDAEVHFARPSIDVLFESAADAYGDRLVGVILTGANSDGSVGLAAIKRRGGVAIVQDPETAERREMPSAAIAAGAADKVLPLDQIGHFLATVCGR